MITTCACRFRRPGLRSSILMPLLLLAALPGCMGDGLSGYQREQNKKEEYANALRAQGATIEEKDYPPYGRGYRVNLSGAQITDDTFQNLKGLERAAELDLSKSSIADDQIDQLTDAIKRLARLDLSHTAVTDVGLEKLANMPAILDLKLTGAKVTPAGVARFKKQHLDRFGAKSDFKETRIQLK